MLNSSLVSIERQIFERFLSEVKALMVKKRIPPPSGFISYAWEAPPDGEPNKKLQAWLSQLKEDFAVLDIDLFLDIQNINGNMRVAMQGIKSRDFVFLIGTPRLKERVEHTILYRLPTFDPRLLPMTGNAIVMVENSDKIYVVEKDHQQLLLIGETTLPGADESQIQWKQEVGYQRAQSSEYVHKLIEQALKQVSVSNKAITNVAYEFGLTLDKANSFPQALMPLLYQGDFDISFPKGISADILIRDFRHAQDYYRQCVGLSPLGLLPAMCPRLQTDRDYAKLVQELLEWKFEVWREQLSHQFNDELQLYIPAHGDCSAECPSPQPMDVHLQEFMQNHAAKVLLLLGGSGSGKTLFGQSVSRLTGHQHYTPLWISLPALQHPQTDAIAEGLRLLGVPESHIPAFKQKPLLIILDGYDEVKNLGNLYESNRLGDWNAKIIITCRTEFLNTKNYALNFKPHNGAFIERHLAPFSPNEVTAYLTKYIELQNARWTLAQYQAEITRLPVLKSLIETPFLLHIVADVLPDIADKYRGQQEQIPLTRRALYERFIDQWFEKHLVRWKGQGKLPLLDEGLAVDAEDDLATNEQRITVLREYAEGFAHRLHSAQIDAVSAKADYPWVKALFDTHPRAKLIRSACPLKKIDDSYTFLHKSLIEYLVTPKEDEISLARLNQPLMSPAMIQFLVDLVTEKPALQSKLWEFIEASKQSDTAAMAAANAITVLNRARIAFSGKDLRGIRIPNADLRGALCDNTNLTNADLTNVNLTGAWLHNTNFNRALMAGVQLGEYPSIKLKSSVSSCRYSPDGRLLAIAEGQNIHLYDAQTHVLVRTLQVAQYNVTSISFSPDGQRLALGRMDSTTVTLWQTSTGVLQSTLEGHTHIVNSVSFSPDGQRLASGSMDETVKLWQVATGAFARLWQAATGALIRTLEGHSSFVENVSFSSDGQCLASGSMDSTVKLWDVRSGVLLHTLKGHTGAVMSLSFSLDGQHLATGSIDNTIKIWQVTTWKLLNSFEGHASSVSSISFSPDGQRLASGSMDNTVKLWETTTGALLRTLEGHKNSVKSVSFSPNGKSLASGSLDNTVMLWEISTDSRFKTDTGHTGSVKSVSFSPDGQRLATGSMDNTIRIWAATGFLIHTLEGHTDSVMSVSFSPDGQCLASGSIDTTVRLWDLRSGAVLHILKGHTRTVMSISFSPDGQCLASGSGDTTVKLWRVKTGALLSTLESDTNTVSTVSASPDRQGFFSGIWNKAVKFWDAGKAVLQGYSNDVTSVSFSPDSQHLASAGGSYDNTLKLWDAGTGDLLHILKDHTHTVKSISFSQDGHCLASGSRDGTVKLWQVEKGVLMRTLEGHRNTVGCVSFSPVGQYLVSASYDRTFRLWKLQSATPHPVITKVTSSINSLCFDAQSEGIFLASGHLDHSVRVWQLMQLNNEPYFQLLWTTHQNALLAQNANISDVRGLSQENAHLLTERGANTHTSSWQQAIPEIPDVAVLTARMAKLTLFSQAGNNAASGSSSSSNNNNNTQQLAAEESQVRDQNNNKSSMM